MDNDEFWKDDAETLERTAAERASGSRMPAASVLTAAGPENSRPSARPSEGRTNVRIEPDKCPKPTGQAPDRNAWRCPKCGGSMAGLNSPCPKCNPSTRANVVGVVTVAALFVLAFFAFRGPNEAAAKANVAAIQLSHSWSEQDAADVRKILSMAISEQLILKVETGDQRANMYILPRFYQLNVDEKRTMILTAYLSAFGLPKQTRKFPWAMAIIDGTTGERIRTVDMDLMGIRW